MMPTPCVITGTRDDIIAKLNSLMAHDRYVEAELAAAQKQCTRWGICFGVCFGATILFAILSWVFLLYLTIPAAIIFLVMLIIWQVRKSKWVKENLENRRLEVAHRLFAIIGQDIPRKTKCALDMSFDHYLTHGQLVEKSGGFLSGIREKKFEDTWFQVRGTLCDSNIFRIRIQQIVQRKEKPKRKYTKVRERITEQIVLSLRVAPESYPDWARLTNLLMPGQLHGLNITRVQVNQGVVRVTAITPTRMLLTNRSGTYTTAESPLTTGDDLLHLFTYVYQHLQSCRPAAAPGAQGA